VRAILAFIGPLVGVLVANHGGGSIGGAGGTCGGSGLPKMARKQMEKSPENRAEEGRAV